MRKHPKFFTQIKAPNNIGIHFGGLQWFLALVDHESCFSLKTLVSIFQTFSIKA